VRVPHKFTAEFDDDNLLARAGLVPVMALAESAGLSGLAREHVTVPGSSGSNADVKVPSLVAGMLAGADSISGMDLLRHGGMDRAFTARRAPTTLGTHLRGYTFGHVRQLDAVASRVLTGLAARVPGMLAGGDEVAFVDIDDTIRTTHGYAKQGAGYGYSGMNGLSAQVAAVSTLQAAPVIAGIRLRRGAAASAHGTASMIGGALATAKRAGVSGMVTVRADSAYFQHATVAAARRGGAHFSITARMNPSVVGRDLSHSRARLGGHQVSPRDLRGGRAAVDLRCRGRRGRVHRLHLPQAG